MAAILDVKMAANMAANSATISFKNVFVLTLLHQIRFHTVTW